MKFMASHRQIRAEDQAAADLIILGRQFYERGWVLGTSGNFSVVLHRRPLQILITQSGAHKGMLSPNNFLRVARNGEVVRGGGQPSAETLIHLAIIARRQVGCVLHTHSVWSTVASERSSAPDGLVIEGFEMLKGLSGVKTHEHREWIPILENSQNYQKLSSRIGQVLASRANLHGILLRRHGLYTWGKDISEAGRHLEILEFLFEIVARRGIVGNADARLQEADNFPVPPVIEKSQSVARRQRMLGS
jgi:methylthioribulose-1-phosphate dehydratase